MTIDDNVTPPKKKQGLKSETHLIITERIT